MSAIGRIFIVLNLILAAAFLGWASNALGTVEDWKGKHAQAVSDHSTAMAAKETELSDHRSKISSLEDLEQDERREHGDQHQPAEQSVPAAHCGGQ